MTHENPETHVPAGDTPVRCPYCDRPFRTDRDRALHLGETHADACTDEERAAYDEARTAEADDLFYYHLRVVAALGVIYALTVLAYMVVLGSG